MDETEITVESILRVLQGVIVATKAPDELKQTLSTRIKQFGISNSGRDSPLEHIDKKTLFDGDAVVGDRLTFEKWRNAFSDFTIQGEKNIRHLSQVVLAVALLREKSRSGVEATTRELDIIWSLLYQAVIGAEGSEVKFSVARSAQGCMAVTLCSLVTEGRIDELWRFHVWLPDGERGLKDVAIHSHQCWGRSWILLGQGTDVTFTAEETDDIQTATHAAYRLHWASSDGSQNGNKFTTHQKSSTIRNTGKLMRLRPCTRELHSRDMSYTIPHATYHQSIVPGGRLHATLFVFDSSRGYDANAGVVGPTNGGDYTQIRAVETVTAASLAHLVNKTRTWEQSCEEEAREGDSEHPVVIGYYQESREMALRSVGTLRN